LSATVKVSTRPPYLNAVACPHCKEAARVRSSKQVTPLIRQLYLRCTNDDCGHVFGGDITITHTISPSACPDAEIMLRQVPPRRAAAINDNPPLPATVVANDNPATDQPDRGPEVPLRHAANDDDGLAEAVSIGS
jgi:hypothetical protein